MVEVLSAIKPDDIIARWMQLKAYGNRSDPTPDMLPLKGRVNSLAGSIQNEMRRG
jgi:hypothetical protein